MKKLLFFLSFFVFVFSLNTFAVKPSKKQLAASDYAITLNGNGALIPLNSAVPSFASSFTISAWINPATNSSAMRTIASWGNGSSDQIGNFFRLEGDNYLYYGQWNGSFKKVKSNAPVINGLWSHVALVKNNNQISIYLNGTDVTGNYVSGQAPMDNNSQGDAFRFGGLFQNGAYLNEYFRGSLDNIAFYNTARTSAQIKAEFENGVNPTETSLWGFWDFDDQANPATDKSTAGHNLTLFNASYALANKLVEPEIGQLSTGFVKNTTARGYIKSDVGGIVYWAVYPSSTVLSNPNDVKTAANALKSGSISYLKPSIQDFWMINGLNTGTNYTLYATIETSGTLSPISKTNFTTTNTTLDLTTQINATKALVSRLLPARAAEFDFAGIEKIDDVLDVFEISSEGNKILIKGSSATSMAAGLRYYLNNYCNASFSWNGHQDELPSPLPTISETIRKETPYMHRYALNYCTMNYTMSFWDWERWEQEIDLMATQGVNLFLSPIGSEAVWQKVMERYGYTFAEIQKFIPGPAYTAWWLMGNLEGEGGPVSQEYIDGRVVLQKKIMDRAKELGMEVVLQGFAGLVPSNIGSKIPEATIHPQGNWFSYTRPAIISGPKALEVAAAWYEESVKLFGAVNYYGGDLFHEGGSVPSNLDVTKYASDIQAEMMKANPEAVWVLQAWSGNPKDAVLNGLKKDQCLILDIANEKYDIWKNKNGFNGIPWVYGVINNFGGRMGIYGRISRLANGVYDMQNHPSKGNIWGIGIVPEAIIFNQVSYDMVWDYVWETSKINPQSWMEKFAAYRYGQKLDNTENAWKILEPTALACTTGQDGGSESVINARPALDINNVSSWSTTSLYYEAARIVPAWTHMINSADVFKDKTTFRYDLVDISRQVLSNFAYKVQKEMSAAFKASNKELFLEKSKLFLEIIVDQDSLLRTREEFLVGKWIDDARKMGTNASEINLFDRNARALITTWDMRNNTALHDYSHREWAGLTRNYYYNRWALFINDLTGRLNGQPAKNYNFFETFERSWQTRFYQKFPTETEGDEIEMSKYIYEKYMPKLGFTLTNSSPTVQTAEFTIPENQAIGTVVGTVIASDPNTTQKLSYSIHSQSVEGAFSINESTGEITINNSEAMKFFSNPSFKLIVKVSDNGLPRYSVYTHVNIFLTTSLKATKDDLSSKIKIHPNPAKSTLKVNLPMLEKVNLSIVDTAGKTMESLVKNEKDFEIDIQNLNNGIYFLKIEGRKLNNALSFIVE